MSESFIPDDLAQQMRQREAFQQLLSGRPDDNDAPSAQDSKPAAAAQGADSQEDPRMLGRLTFTVELQARDDWGLEATPEARAELQAEGWDLAPQMHAVGVVWEGSDGQTLYGDGLVPVEVVHDLQSSDATRRAWRLEYLFARAMMLTLDGGQEDYLEPLRMALEAQVRRPGRPSPRVECQVVLGDTVVGPTRFALDRHPVFSGWERVARTPFAG